MQFQLGSYKAEALWSQLWEKIKINVIKVKGTTMLAEYGKDLKYTVKSQCVSELETTVWNQTFLNQFPPLFEQNLVWLAKLSEHTDCGGWLHICVIFEAFVYTKIYSWGNLKHNVQHLAQCHAYLCFVGWVS